MLDPKWLAIYGTSWLTLFCIWRFAHGLLSGDEQRARLWWAAGFLAHAVHVGAAFVLVHEGSHAAAVLHVADRTEAAVGVRSGAGIWANHLFALGWAIHLSVWSLRGTRPRGWWDVYLAFFAFMVVQAAIIFASWPTRLVTLTALVELSFRAVRAFRTRRAALAPTSSSIRH